MNSAILSSKHFFVCWFMQKDPYPKRNCIYCSWRSKMRCPWRWKFFWDCNQHRHNFIRLGITMGTYIYIYIIGSHENLHPLVFVLKGISLCTYLVWCMAMGQNSSNDGGSSSASERKLPLISSQKSAPIHHGQDD